MQLNFGGIWGRVFRVRRGFGGLWVGDPKVCNRQFVKAIFRLVGWRIQVRSDKYCQQAKTVYPFAVVVGGTLVPVCIIDGQCTVLRDQRWP